MLWKKLVFLHLWRKNLGYSRFSLKEPRVENLFLGLLFIVSIWVFLGCHCGTSFVILLFAGHHENHTLIRCCLCLTCVVSSPYWKYQTIWTSATFLPNFCHQYQYYSIMPIWEKTSLRSLVSHIRHYTRSLVRFAHSPAHSLCSHRLSLILLLGYSSTNLSTQM